MNILVHLIITFIFNGGWTEPLMPQRYWQSHLTNNCHSKGGKKHLLLCLLTFVYIVSLGTWQITDYFFFFTFIFVYHNVSCEGQDIFEQIEKIDHTLENVCIFVFLAGSFQYMSFLLEIFPCLSASYSNTSKHKWSPQV